MRPETPPLYRSTATATTAAPPACLQFAPWDSTLLVVGTYSLHEHETVPEKHKTGSLELYRLSTARTAQLRHLHSLPTPGGAVLDIKFCGATLVVALSRGAIALYVIVAADDDGDARIVLRDTLQLFSPDVLVLSLAPLPGLETGGAGAGAGGVVACTRSDGGVAIVDLATGRVRNEYVPHTLEAWTCEWAGGGGQTLYSGGDDAVFVVLDVRSGAEVTRSRRGAHDAGVTALLARGSGGGGVGEGQLCSGSYDEVLRVWDLRGAAIRAVDRLALGGGVWGLQQMPQAAAEGRVLASCMHAGARVVDVGAGRLEVVARWEDNGSMNYGSHVHADAPQVVASCSFYDRRVCIWSI